MSVPDRLGKYEITEVLGAGAMGVVYRGFDPGIRRVVAIKTIRRELIIGDRPATEMLARFQNEARAAGRLAHPGIVAVYDYGEDASVAYIAMEYVEGNSLREYFNRGTRFAERDVVSIMTQLLEALAHAHERGVWHRDIKPANLIIMMNGRVKVADFGIARIEASDLTQTGAVMGSPGYMAPEQYAARAIDHRADVFAAGVVFYQLLTGARPFLGTAEQVAYAICNTDAPRPSVVDPGKGWERYDALIGKALAKRPEDRFQSAEAFRSALLAAHAGPVAAAISEETIIAEILRPAAAVDVGSSSRPEAKLARPAVPAGRVKSTRPWGWVAVGGGAAALAVAAVAWQILSRNAPSPPPAPVAAAPAVPPPTTRARPEQELVFWESVRNSSSRTELEAYLARYPNGAFTPLARARLDALVAAEAKRDAEERRANEARRAADAARAAEEKRAAETARAAEEKRAVAARRAAEEKRAEERRATEAKAQTASAAPSPIPARRDAAKWQAAIACEAYAGLGTWNGLVDVAMSGASFVMLHGTSDQPGSWVLRGAPAADGRLQLLGTGVSGLARSHGKPYAASFDGRLEGDRYQLAGRLGARNCTLSLPRVDPTGGSAVAAAAAPAPGPLSTGKWQGAIACEAFADRRPFNAVVDVSVSGAEFVLQRGVVDQPGSFVLRGTPGADGSFRLIGSGKSAAERSRGKPYVASFEGKLEGEHYQASGRLGARPCSLSIARVGRS